MLFREEVKYARMQLGLSQTVFAKELNVSYISLSRWENGHTEPQPAIKALFYNYCNKKKIKFEEKK